MSNALSTGVPGADTTSGQAAPSAGNTDTSTPNAPSTSTTPTPTPTPTPPTSTPTPTPSTTTTPPPDTTPTTTPTPTPTTPTTTAPPTTFVTTAVTSNNAGTSTLVTTVTSTTSATTTSPAQRTSSTGTATSTGGTVGPTGSSGGGLSSGGRIAVAVVVPIAAVALLVVIGIFFWRRRKQRKEAEEQRRKEVEDYTFNPNGNAGLAAMAAGGAAGAPGYEMMKEDANSSGYRGWGNTTATASTAYQPSTTMSGGAGGGPAYSDAPSPTRGGPIDGAVEAAHADGSQSPDGEILGAMGPSASNNRGGDVRRGPSNASSSYSAAARSDASGEGGVGMAYGNADPNFYNQYGANNPYTDAPYGSPPQASELGGSPVVIRDNPARRNTRIENPAHYPQQSANVAQNF